MRPIMLQLACSTFMRLMLIMMIAVAIACTKSMAIMMEMVIAFMKINPYYEESGSAKTCHDLDENTLR